MMEKLGPYELNSIVTGDARLLAKEIPDKSVALVVIDPPWDKESLPLYWQSAEIAKRILKNGGWFLVYLGCHDMPKVLHRISQFLRWEEPLCIYQPDSNRKYYPMKIFSTHRPLGLWSNNRNGQPPAGWCASAVSGHRSKNYHLWGQPFDASLRFVEWLTLPDSIVVDFFCGGGLIPVICKILGHRYLAFEIDPETAEIARGRVRNTQPPLFVVQPEQMALLELG